MIGSISTGVVPTEGASELSDIATRYGTHGFHGLRTQDTVAIPFTSVLQSGTKHSNVFCTREYTGITTDTTIHDTSQWVMYLTQQYLVIGLLFSWSDEVMPVAFCHAGPMSIGSIDPVAFLVANGRQIVGMIHTQYIEQVFTGKFTECLSADLFNDILQSNEVQATVTIICLWLETTFASLDVFHQSFRIRRTILFFQFGGRTVGRKTGSVCQQVGNTDGLLFLAVFAFPILEAWEVDTDCIAKTNLSSFYQNHRTDSGRHGLTA